MIFNSENATGTTLTGCGIITAPIFILICARSTPTGYSSCCWVDPCRVSGLFFLFILDELAIEASGVGGCADTFFPVSLHVRMFLPISTVRRGRYVALCISFISLSFEILDHILVILSGFISVLLIVVIGLRSDLIRSWQRDILEGRLAIVNHRD